MADGSRAWVLCWLLCSRGCIEGQFTSFDDVQEEALF